MSTATLEPAIAYEATPRLSIHARLRCSQMGVSTRRVKVILRRPDLTYVSDGARIAWRADDPAICVVFVETPDGQRVALTVLWRTYERYVR